MSTADTSYTLSKSASDFLVRDPDGNLLCFASAVDHAASG